MTYCPWQLMVSLGDVWKINQKNSEVKIGQWIYVSEGGWMSIDMNHAYLHPRPFPSLWARIQKYSSWHPKDRHIKEAVLCNDKRVKVFSTFYSPNMTLAMTKASKTSAPTVVIIRWSLIGQKKFSTGYLRSAKSPTVIANHKLVNKLSMNSCHSFIHSLTHTLINS